MLIFEMFNKKTTLFNHNLFNQYNTFLKITSSTTKRGFLNLNCVIESLLKLLKVLTFTIDANTRLAKKQFNLIYIFSHKTNIC